MPGERKAHLTPTNCSLLWLQLCATTEVYMLRILLLAGLLLSLGACDKHIKEVRDDSSRNPPALAAAE